MKILAVDPGAHSQACALFDDGVLSVVYWCRDVGPRSAGVDRVVVERPQFDGRSLKACKDLIDLAWSGAFFVGGFRARGVPVAELTPRVWKGSTPKPICHRRIWACLAEGERAVLRRDIGDGVLECIERACERGARNAWKRPGAAYYGTWTGHNLLDAVGVGLYHLKRFRHG